jgi:hypothetical protein
MANKLPDELICIIDVARRDILCQRLAEFIGQHSLVDRHDKQYREARIMFRALSRAKCKE